MSILHCSYNTCVLKKRHKSYLQCVPTRVLNKQHKNGTNHIAIITKYTKYPLKISSERLNVSVKIATMQWDITTKVATTKEFFPNIKTRVSTKITPTPNFTALATSYGNIKAYLHRFKIIESPDCPCGGGNQTVDHIIFECSILQDERERLIGKIARQDNWPVNKSKLGYEYIQQFKTFTNSIDFTKL